MAARQACSARSLILVAMPSQKLRRFGCNCLRQQPSRPFTQHFRKRIANLARHRSWILRRKNVIVAHSVFFPCERVDDSGRTLKNTPALLIHLIGNFRAWPGAS